MKMGQLQCHFFHKLIDPFLTDDDEDERIKIRKKKLKYLYHYFQMWFLAHKIIDFGPRLKFFFTGSSHFITVGSRPLDSS